MKKKKKKKQKSLIAKAIVVVAEKEIEYFLHVSLQDFVVEKRHLEYVS
jgi:hypothetical protein